MLILFVVGAILASIGIRRASAGPPAVPADWASPIPGRGSVIADVRHTGSVHTNVFPIDRTTWWIYVETSCSGIAGSRMVPDVLDGTTGKPVAGLSMNLGDGPLNPDDPDIYEYPGGTFRLVVDTKCAWHMTTRG